MVEQRPHGPAPFGTAAPGSPEDNPRVDHEDRDVNVRGILTFLAVLVVGGLVVHVALWWLQAFFVQRESSAKPPLPSPAAEERLRLPRDLDKVPAPRLQISEARDLEELRARENARLQGYGWVDAKTGTVHIPIDRAMDLLTDPQSDLRLPVRGRQP